MTTVVMGNCGFGIAPTRPAGRETIARTLENVEGMSVEALFAGIPWTFETFPEYLDAVERARPKLNVAAMLGHTPLRLYVLGADAVERDATEAEIEEMRRLVGEAIDAGAIGFASSRQPAHAGAWGKPVPKDTAATIVSKAGLSDQETWRLLRGQCHFLLPAGPLRHYPLTRPARSCPAAHCRSQATRQASESKKKCKSCNQSQPNDKIFEESSPLPTSGGSCPQNPSPIPARASGSPAARACPRMTGARRTGRRSTRRGRPRGSGRSRRNGGPGT